MIDLGWYHPSNANWNYSIWLIIDGKSAKLYRETFGGDSRIRGKLEKNGFEVDILYVPFNAQYKWVDVSKMADIEDFRKGELK